MFMKKRRKKWTTKNTHIKRYTKSDYREPEKWYVKLDDWIVLIAAIIFIILVALNNHIVGYDHYIGIPREWVHSLLK